MMLVHISSSGQGPARRRRRSCDVVFKILLNLEDDITVAGHRLPEYVGLDLGRGSGALPAHAHPGHGV